MFKQYRLISILHYRPIFSQNICKSSCHFKIKSIKNWKKYSALINIYCLCHLRKFKYYFLFIFSILQREHYFQLRNIFHFFLWQFSYVPSFDHPQYWFEHLRTANITLCSEREDRYRQNLIIDLIRYAAHQNTKSHSEFPRLISQMSDVKLDKSFYEKMYTTFNPWLLWQQHRERNPF